MKEGLTQDFSQERQNQTDIDRIFAESVKKHRVEPKDISVAMHRDVANKLIEGNQSYLVAAAINGFQDLDPATLIALVDDGRENEVCEYLERQNITDENKEAVYSKVRSKAVVNINE